MSIGQATLFLNTNTHTSTELLIIKCYAPAMNMKITLSPSCKENKNNLFIRYSRLVVFPRLTNIFKHLLPTIFTFIIIIIIIIIVIIIVIDFKINLTILKTMCFNQTTKKGNTVTIGFCNPSSIPLQNRRFTSRNNRSFNFSQLRECNFSFSKNVYFPVLSKGFYASKQQQQRRLS